MSPQMEGRLTDSRRRERVGGTYLASAGEPTTLRQCRRRRTRERPWKRVSRRKTRLAGRKKTTMHKLHFMACVTSSCVHLGERLYAVFRLALIGL